MIAIHYRAKISVSGGAVEGACSLAPGTTVRIREGMIDKKRRLHVYNHAKRGDVGRVVQPLHHEIISGVYVNVAFDSCANLHRLLPEELEQE